MSYEIQHENQKDQKYDDMMSTINDYNDDDDDNNDNDYNLHFKKL